MIIQNKFYKIRICELNPKKKKALCKNLIQKAVLLVLM